MSTDQIDTKVKDIISGNCPNALFSVCMLNERLVSVVPLNSLEKQNFMMKPGV